MCGIAGFVLKGDLPAQKGCLKRMADSIAHRGPDAEGFFVEQGIALANRRLSIIDIAGGKQPMQSEDGRLVIVYNGEVYNFQQIRRELEGEGAKFRTNSDTEAILNAHAVWGDGAIKRFNGMFAYALYDRKEKRLFLARDRLGIKPLHYSLNGSGFFFASEIKALLASGKVAAKPNAEAIVEYLAFQNTFGEKTFFDGVKNLPPGHFAVLENGKLKVKKYFELAFNPKERTCEEDASLFLKTARESVGRHMISDVPVACYLSGGFDSTSVTALSCEIASERISSFTGYFDDKKYDEIECARAVAKKSGSKMHEVKITPKDFLEDIEKIVYQMDEPKAAMSAFSHYEVSKEVSRHAKVVLTGHGGDELFGGYPIFKLAACRSAAKKSPLQFASSFFAGFDPKEIPRLAYFLLFPVFSEEASFGLFVLFSRDERKKLLSPAFYEAARHIRPESSLKQEVGKPDIFDEEYITKLYLKTYLPALFFVEDRVGMAHSIESRTPLCDNELLNLSLEIPLERKLHKNTLKWIIKNAMKSHLPELLYKQTKKGFPTPLAEWFRGPLKNYLYSVFTSEKFTKRGVFNADYCKRLLDSHCRSKPIALDSELVSANRIWSILMVELWFRAFIDKKEA